MLWLQAKADKLASKEHERAPLYRSVLLDSTRAGLCPSDATVARPAHVRTSRAARQLFGVTCLNSLGLGEPGVCNCQQKQQQRQVLPFCELRLDANEFGSHGLLVARHKSGHRARAAQIAQLAGNQSGVMSQTRERAQPCVGRLCLAKSQPLTS